MSQPQKRPTLRIAFFAVIALLMLSELFLSNIGTWLNNLEEIAQQFGITPAAERTRLLILIALDAVAGIGALLATWGYLRQAATSLGRIGVILTTAGLILYGLYQFLSAWFQFTGTMSTAIMSVGVVYVLIGILAWFAGRDLRRSA